MRVLIVHFLFQLGEDELKEALVLVFANKQDLPNAFSCSEITEKLGLSGIHRTVRCRAAEVVQSV